ncbi:MAG: NRDE family protein [Alphaproteobacteria bacterium]|nr:NRDE family protein [Alphaproteobacteria bacterium]
MCTVIILRQPGASWPLILAANRDEMAGRPWKPPARHWPDRPDIRAGIDELAGGSWLGINDYGVVAGILNRVGTLGPEPGKRSRGELVLEALDHAEAKEAAKAMADLNPQAYRPFNLLIADFQDAFWLRNDGASVDVFPVPAGVHMLTAQDLDDFQSPRIRAFLPRFQSAAPPQPDKGDWSGWKALLTQSDPGNGAEEASVLIRKPNGFGTVCSSLIALPGIDAERRPVFLFAPGPPDETEFSMLEPD